MRADEVSALVERQISEFRLNAPQKRTIGVPFSSEQVVSEIELLRASVVHPQLTMVEFGAPDPGPSRQLWLVTRTLENGYLVVFDPECQRFGLAVAGENLPPRTVAVWGDLVGTFMAR